MFFTNKENKNDKKSSIFVYTSFYKKEGQKFETDYDFQFKISLPNTTKNLKIIVEKQQDDLANALSDTSVSSNRQISRNGQPVTRKSAKYTAGAKIDLKRNKLFSTSLNFGIRLDVPLNPYGKFELKKIIKTAPVDITLSQNVILYRQEGLQEFSQVSFNRKFSKNFQTDFVHTLAWTDESDAFSLRHNLVLTQKLNDRVTLAFSIGANAVFKPTFYYNSYDTSLSYSQLLHKDWFYVTGTVGADFVKGTHFNDDKFAQIRFDIYFR